MLQLKCAFLPIQSLANISLHVHLKSNKYIKFCLVLLLTCEGRLGSSLLLILQIWISYPPELMAGFL